MRAIIATCALVVLAGCGSSVQSAAKRHPPTSVEAPPSHAEQQLALTAKRKLRALVVQAAQRCTAAIEQVDALSAPGAATTCASLQLAENPFTPEGARSTSRQLQRDLKLLATDGAASSTVRARLVQLPAQLSFAVTRVILSPPEAARRAEGILERALRLTVPQAAHGDAMATAELTGAVEAARTSLEAVAPLTNAVAPSEAAKLTAALQALPPSPPAQALQWPAYARSVGDLARVSAAISTQLYDFRQGGAYV